MKIGPKYRPTEKWIKRYSMCTQWSSSQLKTKMKRQNKLEIIKRSISGSHKHHNFSHM